uniref:Uncharacterized protein n=1 Tax=Melopsittacus undulatus TaxID=13146 RepID=A0A8V5GR62_MELUD
MGHGYREWDGDMDTGNTLGWGHGYREWDEDMDTGNGMGTWIQGTPWDGDMDTGNGMGTGIQGMGSGHGYREWDQDMDTGNGMGHGYREWDGDMDTGNTLGWGHGYREWDEDMDTGNPLGWGHGYREWDQDMDTGSPPPPVLLDLDPAPPPSAASATFSPWGPRSVPGFPPPWPEVAAVTRMCRERAQAPPPPAAPPLPPSSFGHLRRQAAALSALPTRMVTCCGRADPVRCARRQWSSVLDSFCSEEFSVKTRPFSCCRRRGAQRSRCFRDAAAEAAAELPVPEVPFPPGEPTADNVGNICGLRGLRRALDRFHLRLEREFGSCCRMQEHTGMWVWDRLCQEEAAQGLRPRLCCEASGLARISCFAAAAPAPRYDRELHNVSLGQAGPELLRVLCGPARLLSRRWVMGQGGQWGTRPIGDLIPLLGRTIASLCSARGGGAWKDPLRCCAGGDAAERRRCFNSAYLQRVLMGLALPPPAPGHEE